MLIPGRWKCQKVTNTPSTRSRERESNIWRWTVLELFTVSLFSRFHSQTHRTRVCPADENPRNQDMCEKGGKRPQKKKFKHYTHSALSFSPHFTSVCTTRIASPCTEHTDDETRKRRKMRVFLSFFLSNGGWKEEVSHSENLFLFTSPRSFSLRGYMGERECFFLRMKIFFQLFFFQELSVAQKTRRRRLVNLSLHWEFLVFFGKPHKRFFHLAGRKSTHRFDGTFSLAKLNYYDLLLHSQAKYSWLDGMQIWIFISFFLFYSRHDRTFPFFQFSIFFFSLIFHSQDLFFLLFSWFSQFEYFLEHFQTTFHCQAPRRTDNNHPKCCNLFLKKFFLIFFSFLMFSLTRIALNATKIQPSLIAHSRRLNVNFFRGQNHRHEKMRERERARERSINWERNILIIQHEKLSEGIFSLLTHTLAVRRMYVRVWRVTRQANFAYCTEHKIYVNEHISPAAAAAAGGEEWKFLPSPFFFCETFPLLSQYLRPMGWPANFDPATLNSCFDGVEMWNYFLSCSRSLHGHNWRG